MLPERLRPSLSLALSAWAEPHAKDTSGCKDTRIQALALAAKRPKTLWFRLFGFCFPGGLYQGTVSVDMASHKLCWLVRVQHHSKRRCIDSGGSSVCSLSSMHLAWGRGSACTQAQAHTRAPLPHTQCCRSSIEQHQREQAGGTLWSISEAVLAGSRRGASPGRTGGKRSGEAEDPAGLEVDVDVEEAGARRQPRHRRHGPDDRVHEPRSCPHRVTPCQHPACLECSTSSTNSACRKAVAAPARIDG